MDKTFLTFWYKFKQQDASIEVKIVKKFFFYFKVFVIYYFVEYYRPLLKTFSVTNLDTLSRTTTLVSCQRIINDCLCTKYFFSEKVFVISFPSHLKTEIITRGEMYSQNLSVIYNCFLHIVLCLNCLQKFQKCYFLVKIYKNKYFQLPMYLYNERVQHYRWKKYLSEIDC